MHKSAPAILLTLGLGFQAQAQPSRDIPLIQSKIDSAQKYFARVWSSVLSARGAQFQPPRVIAFTGSYSTACGKVTAGNGFQCAADNSIYLDAAFLAGEMRDAAAALRTDGDFAAIVIAAHEFGHAVAAQLKVVFNQHPTIREYASEQMADCFAGAVTRQAKGDGLLEAGDLAEGLYSLAHAGDGARDPKADLTSMRGQLRFTMSHGISHGFARSRQAAFLQGYYLGPNVCSVRLGPAPPPAAQRVIASNNLRPLQLGRPSSNLRCTWSYTQAGMLLADTSQQFASCLMNLLPPSAALTDHLRIEVTSTLQGGKEANDAGIYYADPKQSGKVARYGYGTNGFGGLSLYDPDNFSNSYGGFPLSGQPWNLDKINGPGKANRITLDIHHEGAGVYFLKFVNGILMDFAMNQYASVGFTLGRRLGEEAGLYIRLPGTKALFTDFQVSALRD